MAPYKLSFIIIIIITSKSEAAVTGDKKNCTVGMLKLTTDKHE